MWGDFKNSVRVSYYLRYRTVINKNQNEFNAIVKEFHIKPFSSSHRKVIDGFLVVTH